MWENGKKYFDKTDIADLPATYKRNRKEIDIVSAGWVCRYSKVFKTILIASVVFIPFVKMTLHYYISVSNEAIFAVIAIHFLEQNENIREITMLSF